MSLRLTRFVARAPMVPRVLSRMPIHRMVTRTISMGRLNRLLQPKPVIRVVRKETAKVQKIKPLQCSIEALIICFLAGWIIAEGHIVVGMILMTIGLGAMK